MVQDNTRQELLSSVVRTLLGLPDTTVAGRESPLKMNVRPDLVLTDGDDMYLIEVVGKASVQDVAQLLLMQRLMKGHRRAHFILAAKLIPTSVLETANEAGIRTITLPPGVAVAKADERQKVKLTTEKAWRVTTRLLREKACSIRQIALKEDLSYGWAHTVVKRLTARGIAEQNGNLVRVSDVNGLLDVVAWERPLVDLRLGTLKCKLDTTYEAAETISRSSKEWGMSLSFTAYTAASLYVGYSSRHDAVYCYVADKAAFLQLKDALDDDDGIEVICHKIDRDVFSSSRSMEGIDVTSPQQTLLDLVGLGYSARDLALEMVKHYAKIPEHNA